MHEKQSTMGRRSFLADAGMGFTGLALSAMLFRDGVARAVSGPESSDGRPHFDGPAKSVIWIFLVGGASHLETFDPKPALNKYADKSIDETPYKSVLASERANLVDVSKNIGGRKKLMRLNVGYRKFGQSGLEISDWWPHVGSCADDLAIVRSLWNTDAGHGAQLQFHTGRHVREGAHPSIGSWVRYGLGTLNQNLPEFVVLGQPSSGIGFAGDWPHGAGYLGSEHAGVRIDVDPKAPLPFATPPRGVSPKQQTDKFKLLGELHQLSSGTYPEDSALRARIKAYELAFQMQTSVPEVLKLQEETASTQSLYGLDQRATRPFGELCLTARRLVERGVRFVQLYHGADSSNGQWDAHANLRESHGRTCGEVDRPIAGLLKDLKRRGLLGQTLVVLGTEFGRSPGTQGGGRDHHAAGFCCWLAGGGIKGGIAHGATDELGFHAVENRHYITDIHATVLHQLGLDSRRLEFLGRKRLEIDYGKPIREIMA